MSEKPARLMTDAEIAVEIFAVEQRFDEYRAACDGKSGSPGEWLVERLDELETEKLRRAAL